MDKATPTLTPIVPKSKQPVSTAFDARFEEKQTSCLKDNVDLLNVKTLNLQNRITSLDTNTKSSEKSIEDLRNINIKNSYDIQKINTGLTEVKGQLTNIDKYNNTTAANIVELRKQNGDLKQTTENIQLELDETNSLVSKCSATIEQMNKSNDKYQNDTNKKITDMKTSLNNDLDLGINKLKTDMTSLVNQTNESTKVEIINKLDNLTKLYNEKINDMNTYCYKLIDQTVELNNKFTDLELLYKNKLKISDNNYETALKQIDSLQSTISQLDTKSKKNEKHLKILVAALATNDEQTNDE
jgi:chromosome segregation ATPase